jgi:hypothetical protein
MPFLHTWGHGSAFTYEGSVRRGTRIAYGAGALSTTGTPHIVDLPCLYYLDLLKHFSGLTVAVGTSRTAPPGGSLGDWLLLVVTQTAIASYVAPILIYEGYAERVNDHEIRILPASEWAPDVAIPCS